MPIFQTGSIGANKTLSNIENTIAIPQSVNLLPITHNTTSLGGISPFAWQALYAIFLRDCTTNQPCANLVSRQLISYNSAAIMDWSGTGTNPSVANAGVAFKNVLIGNALPADGSLGYININTNVAGFSGIYNFTLPTNDGVTFASLTSGGSGICTWTKQVIASYEGASHGIPDTTNTVVRYPSSNYDANTAYNGTSGIFTAPITGKYRVTAAVEYGTPSAVGFRKLGVFKNGTVARTGNGYLPSAVQAQDAAFFSGTINLAATDTLSVYATQTSGATSQLSGATLTNYINIERVGG